MTELEQLKLLCQETDDAAVYIVRDCNGGCPGCDGTLSVSARACTDQQLMQQLALEGGDVKRAAYRVLMLKARASAITLPNGMTLPDQSGYYRRLAALCRQSRSRTLHRADDPPRERQDDD